MLEQLFFLYFYYHTTSFSPPVGIPPMENIVWPLMYEEAHGITRTETQFPAPHRNGALIKPLLTAEAVFVKDLGSQTVLFQENMHKPLRIASISKLVTAMVILDEHKLDEIITVPSEAREVEGSKVWFYEGEQLTIQNMLRALLISSGNDAAVALSIFNSGSEKEFVKKMNLKVQSFGLKHTNFTNSTGLDDYDNFSTAYDISVFAEKALTYDFIKKTVQISKMNITSVDGKLQHKLESTNKLLNNQSFDVIGLKTGRTVGAGEALVSLTKHPTGREILSVVLKSDNRFSDTEFLLDWIYRAYEFSTGD